MALPLLVDTDIGTNVDDALALALAARHPGLDLRAVTTVCEPARQRARIARRLLLLTGRDDVEVAAGVDAPSPGPLDEALLAGADDVPPRTAADVLAAHPGAAVAALGPLTNIAVNHAEPLTVMGGIFGPGTKEGKPLTPAADTNLRLDPAAAVRVLSAGPVRYVPLDVTVRSRLGDDALRRLRGGDPLCRAVAEAARRWSARTGRPVALHDPLAVACLAEPSLVTVEELPVTVTVGDGTVRTAVDPVAGRPVEVVRDVDAPRLVELLLDTLLG